MPDNGVILVVTDAGTKQKNLEESIKKKRASKYSSPSLQNELLQNFAVNQCQATTAWLKILPSDTCQKGECQKGELSTKVILTLNIFSSLLFTRSEIFFDGRLKDIINFASGVTPL